MTTPDRSDPGPDRDLGPDAAARRLGLRWSEGLAAGAPCHDDLDTTPHLPPTRRARIREEIMAGFAAEFPAARPVVPPPPASAADARSHPSRSAPEPWRWPLQALASVLLVAALAGAALATVRELAPALPPSNSPRAVATPQPGPAITPLVTTIDLLSPGTMGTTVYLFRERIGPGSTMRAPIVAPGPVLIAVEQGSATVIGVAAGQDAATPSLDAPLLVAHDRADGRVPDLLPATDSTVRPGEWVVVPSGASYLIGNPGDSEATLFIGLVGDGTSHTPAATGLLSDHPLGIRSLPTAPMGPVRVTMNRVTLPAGSALAPPPDGEFRVFAPEDGDQPRVRVGADGSATNTGDRPVTLHMLSIAPPRSPFPVAATGALATP